MSLFLQNCNASIKNKYGSCEFDVSRIFLVTKHQCVVKMPRTVEEILANTVSNLFVLLFQYLLLIGQTGFRTSKMSLRRNSNPTFEHKTMLDFAKLSMRMDSKYLPNWSLNLMFHPSTDKRRDSTSLWYCILR